VKKLAQRLQKRSYRYAKAVRQAFSPSRSSSRPLTVFVSGVHRSGTNMVMTLLDASDETTVYHETDPRGFDCYMMRPPDIIQNLINRSRSKIVVVKALHESHDLSGLMERFSPARVFWVFRDYEAVVNSSLQHWPGWRNKIESIVVDRTAGDWRGLGMTDVTHEMLRAVYRPDLTDASVTALFWCYRNQLYFDQKLDHDARVSTLFYDEAVRSPEAVVRRVALPLSIRPTARMERIARAQATPNLSLDIDPRIRELCIAMQRTLLDVHERGAGRV
jgi:hypothetical protein